MFFLHSARYVSFLLRAVILPFGGSYEPLLLAFGQIAAWLSLLLIASFHVRRHIGGRAPSSTTGCLVRMTESSGTLGTVSVIGS